VKTVKRWLLNQQTFDQSDQVWLSKWTDYFDTKRNNTIYETYNGRVHVAGELQIIVQTSTPNQENMLQLKYGRDLYLLNVLAMYPGQVYQDQYGTVTSF
jgi:hypothetical protein